jgi:hypothetical protein
MATAEPMAQPLPVGNYKGVMLCNRPDDASSPSGRAGARGAHGASRGVRPSDADGPVFMPPGMPSERLGLNPARDNTVTNVVAREADVTAMRETKRLSEQNSNYMYRHRKWCARPRALLAAPCAPGCCCAQGCCESCSLARSPCLSRIPASLAGTGLGPV